MKKEQLKRLLRFRISVTNKGVRELQFGSWGKSSVMNNGIQNELARRWKVSVVRELKNYLSGEFCSFSIPVDLRNLSPFAQAVLKITSRIPYGQVRSYRWIAERLSKPKAGRAVGNALANNPIPILIPCHRVVRGDGSLGGYILGLRWKKMLLALEKYGNGRKQTVRY